MKPRTVKMKLFIGVLLTSLSALLVTGIALAFYDLHNVKATLASDLGTQAELIGKACVPALQFDDAKVANDNLTLLQARPLIDAAALYDAQGVLFAHYTRNGSEKQDFPRLPEEDSVEFTGEDIIINHRIVDSDKILGSIYLRAHYNLYQRVLSYTGILLAVGSFALLISLLLSTWLQQSVTKPILAITAVAQQVVEKGNFLPRAEKITDDEIGYLVDAFNRMLGEIGRRTEELEASNSKLVREATERLRVEGEMRQLNAELEARVAERTQMLQESNKELEAFSYSVSHDLRAPLRAIDGFSMLLETSHGTLLDEEGKRLLGVVRQSSRHMGALIEDLLAFARLGRKTVATSVTDMDQLARECADEVLNAAETRPQLTIGRLPAAQCDRALVKQVWLNLIGNAVKYTSHKRTAWVEISANGNGEQLVYTVRDNGAGFDMRYYEKLFGVFQRLHASEEFPGTGVGLAIVHRIIAKHGGRVWAEAAPEQGAAFHFSLPNREHSP